MLEAFGEMYRDRHAYARAWKERTGGMVLGYSCTYVPEEILCAAGVLPVRLLGGDVPAPGPPPEVLSVYCPFCRDWLAEGLAGGFEYVDGLMMAQACLNVRQAYLTWRQHRPLEFAYYLSTPPRVANPHAREFLAAELQRFRSAVEEWVGRPITDDAIRDGIRVVNRARRLARELYERRRGESPPVTGVEAMEIVLALQMTDKQEHADLLEAALKTLHERPPVAAPGAPRLLLVGSEDDDLGIVRAVEKAGGLVVMDEHCTGSRYFWNEVQPGPDVLRAIADRYCDRPPCPTKDWEERTRVELILRYAREWSCAGTVVIRQRLCDPHEVDAPAIRDALEAAGYPVLMLEARDPAQAKGHAERIEGFLELLRAGR